jgi:hypothetical protein
LNRIFKDKKALAGILAVFVLLGFGIFYIISQKKSQISTTSTTSPGESRYRLKIEKLAFFGMHQGQKVLSIAADNFIIEKKKIGFFSFSLANVARLYNTRIDIYAYDENLERKDQSSTFPVKNPISDTIESKTTTGMKTPFQHIFAEETLSSFPASLKSITSIEAIPISVFFYNGDKLLTGISSSSATIRLNQREILFSGNVRVISGKRELTTEELAFIPESGILRTVKPFIMQTDGEQRKGKRATTDIFLRQINIESKINRE